jgi:hypothetical protein
MRSDFGSKNDEGPWTHRGSSVFCVWDRRKRERENNQRSDLRSEGEISSHGLIEELSLEYANAKEKGRSIFAQRFTI